MALLPPATPPNIVFFEKVRSISFTRSEIAATSRYFPSKLEERNDSGRARGL